MGLHENNRSALAFLLRKYIPPEMEGLIAERLGKSVRSVEGYRYGETGIGSDDLLALFPVLGPAFVNEVLSLVGMGGVAWLNRDQCLREVHVTVSKLDAKLTELGADGVFDHNDRAILQPMLNEAAPKIAAAAGRR